MRMHMYTDARTYIHAHTRTPMRTRMSIRTSRGAASSFDTPADIRFIRRLLRDQSERGRSADSVVAQYLATVRPGHERLTEPSRTHADFIVADATAAVRLEDPQAVVRLAAPVLAHPLLAPFLTD